MCSAFASDCAFRIAGSSDGKPIAVTASGVDGIPAMGSR